MNAVAKRAAVAIAVVLMFIMPLSVFIDQTDTEAAEVDYTKWYYSQLNDDARIIYDKLEALKGGTTNSFTVDGKHVYPEYKDKTISDISEDTGSGKTIKVESTSLKAAMNAIKMDDPGMYWTSLSMTMMVSGTNISGSTVTVTTNLIDGIPYNTTGDSIIAGVINSAKSSGDLTVVSDKIGMAKNIHDYLTHKLSYATAALNAEKSSGQTNHSIRSTYTAFTNDSVVCEGYAKAFKYLCDMYEIPCITIVGNANNGTSSESHMWNRVLGNDGFWYTVDVTWDDPVNGSERSDYFMVGQNSKVGTLTVAQSHSTTTVTSEYGFTLPTPVSNYEYSGARVIVSFESNGGSDVPKQDLKIGEPAVRPENPKYLGHAFYDWYADPELTISWNWNTKVFTDTTIYAKWTELTAYSVTFMANGGDDAPDTIIVYEGDYAEIPEKEPTRNKFKFVEWNTMDDGTGTSYKPGNMLAPIADVTLYAIWEEKDDDFISGIISAINVEGFLSDTIDPFIEDLKKGWEDFKVKSEEYLGEAWIPGIANIYVIIAGAVLFFIIAVAATRKK